MPRAIRSFSFILFPERRPPEQEEEEDGEEEEGRRIVHCCTMSLCYLGAETGYRVATPYSWM